MPGAQDPTLFIGSSSEGLDVAEELQAVLDDHCESELWNQGTFGLSGTGIESLVQASRSYDFAVFVLSADDMVTKRGKARPAARDNILFEAGLFIGSIGRERTFLLACKDDEIDLPSDLAGVTMAQYRRRANGNLAAALSPASRKMRQRMKELGLHRNSVGPAAVAPPSSIVAGGSLEDEMKLLEDEFDSLSISAEAQGWRVKTRSKTAYRLVAPDGRRFSLTIGDPRKTRDALRSYVRELNQNGLRANRSLVTPVGEPLDTSGERPIDG